MLMGDYHHFGGIGRAAFGRMFSRVYMFQNTTQLRSERRMTAFASVFRTVRAFQIAQAGDDFSGRCVPGGREMGIELSVCIHGIHIRNRKIVVDTGHLLYDGHPQHGSRCRGRAKNMLLGERESSPR